jgi:hypothetical protein
MYSGQHVRVLWNGIFSCEFPVKNGVKQGGIISPIGRQTGIKPAKQVFHQLDADCPPGSGPRNMNQVYSKMSAVRRQSRTTVKQNGANFADGFITVLNMLQTDSFVQSVVADRNETPNVILYSPCQLDQIRKFCFDRREGSVLTFDSTFNVTKGMYVTSSVYRNLSLLRRKSGKNNCIVIIMR